jgi:hypothetical protein
MAVATALVLFPSLAAAGPQPHLAQPHIYMSRLGQSGAAASNPEQGLPGQVWAQDASGFSLTSNELDFGMAGPTAPDPIIITGHVTGADPAYKFALLLPTSDSQMDLPWLTSLPGLPTVPGDPTPADIPASWQLRMRLIGSWGPWQNPQIQAGAGTAGPVYWWVLPMTQGVGVFELQCTLQPDPYQPPGHYERDLPYTLTTYTKP